MSTPQPILPLVWLPLDHRASGDGPQAIPYLFLGEKYAEALQRSAGVQPCTFPLADSALVAQLLAGVDGVLLPGSPANIDPVHFGQPVTDPSLPLDHRRDALTLTLVRECVLRGVPIFGVCRGFQEMNVALGGSLHQQVQDLPGKRDHREDKALSYDGQYAPAHTITLLTDPSTRAWAGSGTVRVNSLHGQGVDRLADALEPLAHAEDGIVEMARVRHATAFAYGTQFHPEYKSWETPFYHAIFSAFGDACRKRMHQRLASYAK
jgi:putative glutamine amidotransferase